MPLGLMVDSRQHHYQNMGLVDWQVTLTCASLASLRGARLQLAQAHMDWDTCCNMHAPELPSAPFRSYCDPAVPASRPRCRLAGLLH